jgi:hypothetical protein
MTVRTAKNSEMYCRTPNPLQWIKFRVTQFFYRYLKDAPPPKWMTDGIPARLKGIES